MKKLKNQRKYSSKRESNYSKYQELLRKNQNLQKQIYFWEKEARQWRKLYTAADMEAKKVEQELRDYKKSVEDEKNANKLSRKIGNFFYYVLRLK
jgi:hypothetical protein